MADQVTNLPVQLVLLLGEPANVHHRKRGFQLPHDALRGRLLLLEGAGGEELLDQVPLDDLRVHGSELWPGA